MKKNLKKIFFLLGMGKSGISLPNFYLVMELHTYAGTIMIKKDYLLQENFNLSTVNLNNLKQCFS